MRVVNWWVELVVELYFVVRAWWRKGPESPWVKIHQDDKQTIYVRR